MKLLLIKQIMGILLRSEGPAKEIQEVELIILEKVRDLMELLDKSPLQTSEMSLEPLYRTLYIDAGLNPTLGVIRNRLPLYPTDNPPGQRCLLLRQLD